MEEPRFCPMPFISWHSFIICRVKCQMQSWIAGLYFNNFVKHHFSARGSISSVTTTENNNNSSADHDNDADNPSTNKVVALCNKSYWSKRRLALILSLWVNLLITVTKLAAPEELIDEFMELAERFHGRLIVDTCQAYHFRPKFLVEIKVLMPDDTPLKKSHDLGMKL